MVKQSKPITRPTSSKVRQALFNIWQGRQLQDSSWLDLCAGTGAVGTQALLEGAKEVVGMEINHQACQNIQKAWQKFSSPCQSFRVIQGNILTKLHHLSGEKFDFIYFDPPYQSGLYEPTLRLTASLELLDSQAEMAIEHDPKFWQPTQCLDFFKMHRQKKYGDTFLSFFIVP